MQNKYLIITIFLLLMWPVYAELCNEKNKFQYHPVDWVLSFLMGIIILPLCWGLGFRVNPISFWIFWTGYVFAIWTGYNLK